jgi:site-specific DNA-methyltransferase (adenine-specific)
MNKVHLCDCMEFMKGVPDKYYELAIVDPPYGINMGELMHKESGKQTGVAKAKRKEYLNKDWDSKPPDREYFCELIRVSKNQIVWGANHFISNIPFDSACWLVWDKHTNGLFADCELAYTSFKTAVRKFDFMWNGMLQKDMKNKEQRIHPTQKPVALYKWILKNYAKPNDKIFDSHVGSGSIRIACHDMGFDFEGCEIDKDYWEAQEERFNTHISQLDLMTPEFLFGGKV